MKFISRKPKLLFLIISIAVLIVTVLAAQNLVQTNAEKRLPPKAKRQHAANVSIVWQQPASYQSLIKAYGSVEPHYEMVLTAQVSGQVEALAQQFETGNRINRQDWLAKLDNSSYKAAVAEAKQTLADANVALLEEQRQGQQALMEWQTSGLKGEPDSELVLRKPQLMAAKAVVEKARSQLASAEKELSYATIKAPFDAIVIEREISPGSYVQQGNEIATLYSTDRIEIELSLSAKDWQNLPSLNELQTLSWPVTINSIEDNGSWQGYVLRAEQHLNSETRQQSLIIAVDNPFDMKPALLPGTFVGVVITGATQTGLWRLPSSALSQRGEVWFINEQQSLSKIARTPMFSRDGDIFIAVPDALTTKRIAVLTNPLNSYIEGMKVNGQEAYDE